MDKGVIQPESLKGNSKCQIGIVGVWAKDERKK